MTKAALIARALRVFRESPSAALYTPAPGGISVEEGNALVESGLAVRGRTVGRQVLIILTAEGLLARDGLRKVEPEERSR